MSLKFKANEILPDKSSDDAESSVTREPISIFSWIKIAKDKEEKKKLNQLLKILRKELPEGLKIGAAVSEGDCFFDSIAQTLNELKDKDLITGNKRFSVKSLRKNCKHYAQLVNQSEKVSWLHSALKEGEKLCEYIHQIEFTTEDTKNTSSGSEIKILKLENVIWGRPEVEGKMICEKYGVKIRTIELRDEEIDGLHVTKGKVGRGNNIIYLVNYRNHFVPLLSNIEKDTKRSIKVSKEEAYGNVKGSQLNSISQSYISTPSQNTENFPRKESGGSRGSGKENIEVSRKRGCSVIYKDGTVSKRLCLDIDLTGNEDLEFPNNLQNKPGQDELGDACQTNPYIPRHLIRLMYRLDLSILCLLRKSMYEHKYPSFSLTFEDPEMDKFNNIVLRCEERTIHVQIEKIVGKYYIGNGISYARLFTKEKRSVFYINDYFNSFVKHLISKLDSVSNSIEYLIIYTNSCLDLTGEKELRKGRSRNFYPFKFDCIEECDILKDFLFTNNNSQGPRFYQFSRNKTTREELLKRLEFSPAMQKVIKKRKLFQNFEKEIKEAFLDKLVFAVNQPNREELSSIIKREIEKNSKIQDDHITLQNGILSNFEERKELGSYVSGIIFEFNLLMLFLHDMFLHKNIFSINLEGENYAIPNGINICSKGRITYLKAHNADSSINYSQLFPSRQQKNMFSVNKHFALFAEGLKHDVRYFIIYTNGSLDLTEEKKLKKERSKAFYPLKFDSIDIQKKKYKTLRYCSCINKDSLYQFSQEETREKLLSLLKLPPSLHKEEEKLSNERKVKENFLDRLIFAVNQPSKKILSDIITNKIDESDVPCSYGELREITLRWLESHQFRPARKGIMGKLLEDIKNYRSCYQRIENRDINEEIKFAKSVISREETFIFDQFLVFLIKGEGKKCLEVLKRKGINLANVSSILGGAGANASKAFKDLYDLWFDEKGNKTQYLKTLEEEGINLANISSILNGVGVNFPKAFKGLYDLWFDEQGNKTQYLKTLEEEGISLANVSSILSGSRANAAKAFNELHNLWFDKEGNKTQYLKTLKKGRISLANVSSIIGGAGANAAKTFKELYSLWFDEAGNKTQYLKTLEKEEINLANVSSILGGTRTNATKAFKDLYNVWFDEKGNKTIYLKTLEKEGINLRNISSILNKARANAAKAFKDLFNLWFDKEGNKTQYLKSLKKEGIDLANISSILSGAGANASKAFTDLYNLWFDIKGNKTIYLKTLKQEGVNLANISNILHGARANAAKAFKDLCNVWFDDKGNKTQYLKILEEKGVNLCSMSTTLGGAGANAAKAFKDLYDLWFDKQRNKTQYLKTLEKEEIDLTNVASILSGAGANAAKAFKELYDAFFDKRQNKTQHLKHFINKKGGEESFTICNLSSMLGRAGDKAKDAFEKLHSVCYTDEGKKTKLLDDFFKADFKWSNLSCILCGAGARASSILERLHSICFDDKGDKTKLLDDFFNAGFTPYDLCNILSRAADSIEEFHDFCCVGETRKYLSHFSNGKKSFTVRNLCNILHGAGATICSALKDFHDVCFYEAGNKTQLLNDFDKVGFSPSELSNVLSMAGNNATSILKNFYESCFNKENYLNHFLAEGELFAPKNLSKILYGVGTKICSAFKKLHDLCYDKEGNRTNYVNNLIENNPSSEIINILYKKVRKAPLS